YNDKLKDIYYYGTEEQWNSIRIEGNNTALTEVTIHFLGEDDIHTHLYTEVTIIEPTCTEIGTKTYTCTCGDTYTESIPATNHANATTDPGKAPTETEVGYTAGKYCPDCKTWIEGHEEIPMLHTHSYTSTVTQEATCWREGMKTYTCTCGESYTEAIAKLDHEYRPWETKKNPTCTAPGLEWSYCLLCDNDFEREIPATGHTVIDYTRRATPDSDGAYVNACDVCNEVFKSISFGRPTEYKLSTTKYTYDGKTKTPKLTVETSDGVVLKEGVDYELELPSGRKAVGVYTYRVVFKGNFLGEKKVSYQILPGKTSKITATQSTSAIKLTWKKVTGATGYRVYQYNSKTGKYEKIKTLTGTSYTVKKLKAGTTYKFAVKAYTKDNGETLWAASSVSMKTATKPATPTVKATAGSKQATISWNKVTGATGYVVYMQDEFGDYEKLGSTKKTSYTRKKLTKGETYYFRVRAYKTVDGKNIYGGYKTVKVKVK
ncbi:MAG: fibronectin type III domain-containing protein, partial [Clostridia bacterium]|nr:fibronectin type III domain-containing protein [Clostridia bacterium]